MKSTFKFRRHIELKAVCPDFFAKMRKILLKMREKMRHPKNVNFFIAFLDFSG